MLKSSASEAERLIDALPYIDTVSSEEMKVVTKLISEEVARSEKQPSDYLKEMPNSGVPSFGGSALLQSEYQRVKEKQPMPAVDTHRYTLSAPPLEKQNDPEEWRKALDNAHAQLEHQHLRILNLELCLKYGPESWRMDNEQTEKLTESFSQQVDNVKDSITDINKKRKLFQTEVGKQLQKLESEWMHLVIKNYKIAKSCKDKRTKMNI